MNNIFNIRNNLHKGEIDLCKANSDLRNLAEHVETLSLASDARSRSEQAILSVHLSLLLNDLPDSSSAVLDELRKVDVSIRKHFGSLLGQHVEVVVEFSRHGLGKEIVDVFELAIPILTGNAITDEERSATLYFFAERLKIELVDK